MSAHATASPAGYDYGEYEDSSLYNYDIINSDNFEFIRPGGEILNISMAEIRAMNFNASTDVIQNLTHGTTNKVYMFAFAILFVVGIFGHTTVMYLMSRFKHRHDATNIYIVNVSIAQMMFLIGCLPAITAKYIVGGWTFGSTWCEYIYMCAV